ncbi:hypothetical protein A936_13127 [Enterobacter sp. Ag1]|nr:hypothetical protein A936_13127 [Enterobacter sp. Ag1]
MEIKEKLALSARPGCLTLRAQVADLLIKPAALLKVFISGAGGDGLHPGLREPQHPQLLKTDNGS